MRIEYEPKLDFDDVLLKPKRSTLNSRSEVDLERNFKFRHGAKDWTGIPIIASNMDGIGTKSMMKSLASYKMLTALVKHYEVHEYQDLLAEYAFITFGLTEADFEKIKNIKKVFNPRLLCLDVANGYTERFSEYVKRVRELCPDSIIMAGNVVTGEMTEELILGGADIVKVGIGSGSVCLTRRVAGVGYPQLSAIIECADAAHGLGGQVCADGGIRSSGDVAKAFGAGADFVMIGNMFSGHTESEFEIIEKDGQKFLPYYGSSSNLAMQKHQQKQNYRASEGREVLVNYKGDVAVTVEEMLGGLRSASTYIGARRLKDFSKCTTFVRVNQQLNTFFEK